MHFCFIDESGTPPKKSATNPQPYFVIAGVVMHESQWHGIAKDFRALTEHRDYRIRGEVKWRYFGADSKDPKNSVKHLSAERRDAFRKELFDVIAKRKSVKIIACVASVVAAYETAYVKNDTSLYHYTYKPISERFQYHLQDLSRTVGDEQLGLVVADHRGRKQDDNFRRVHDSMVDDLDQPFVSKYGNFVESLFLTPSHHSIGVQLADMVAGAIGRRFNSKDSRFFDQIQSSFRANPTTGSIDGYGLVKFPKAGWR